jgi:hypothetical protein
VLAGVKASGRVVKAVAIDDFVVTIPMADTRQRQVIVARLLDSKPMAVHDQGPLCDVPVWTQRNPAFHRLLQTRQLATEDLGNPLMTPKHPLATPGLRWVWRHCLHNGR